LVLIAAFLFCRMACPAFAGPYEDATKAYERGDYKTAAIIFNILAEQGNASAQGALGLMYEQGIGVPQDYVLAYMLYYLAFMGAPVTEDSDLWAKNRRRIAYKMTTTQIYDAQRLAREWKQKKER
jgi:hypothetical protein